ncbi:MAG TPA: PadR family transcriptional regulator [Reyranella sp.]|jgi:DNA-binding PadR family transcriptional regulator|nr:PadR family transcriptional regulator [Reyranella sp.]
MRPSHHLHDHRSHAHRHAAGHRGRHGFGRSGRGEADDSRGGGRRRRVFDSGELRLVLLKLIADQPRHGYDLIRAIEELTGGSYVPSPGVVYPTLTLLQDMGQIEEAPSGGARKQFVVTEEGTAHLAEKKLEVEALFERLSQLATAHKRTDGGPIRRAMENLRAALMYRLDRDVEAETLHAAAAILDEAAQKIERL